MASTMPSRCAAVFRQSSGSPEFSLAPGGGLGRLGSLSPLGGEMFTGLRVGLQQAFDPGKGVMTLSCGQA